VRAYTRVRAFTIVRGGRILFERLLFVLRECLPDTNASAVGILQREGYSAQRAGTATRAAPAAASQATAH